MKLHAAKEVHMGLGNFSLIRVTCKDEVDAMDAAESFIRDTIPTNVDSMSCYPFAIMNTKTGMVEVSYHECEPTLRKFVMEHNTIEKLNEWFTLIYSFKAKRTLDCIREESNKYIREVNQIYLKELATQFYMCKDFSDKEVDVLKDFIGDNGSAELFMRGAIVEPDPTDTRSGDNDKVFLVYVYCES